MIFIINAQGTITAVSPSPVHQGSIGVNDIILVSPALADGVTLNATLPNGIKIDPINMGLVYPSVIEGYTEGYYIYRTTLDESVTQYSGLLSLRFSLKLKNGGTLTTSTAVIPIAEDMSIIAPLGIDRIDKNAATAEIIVAVNQIIDTLNYTISNISSVENARADASRFASSAYTSADNAEKSASASHNYAKQAEAWATGTITEDSGTLDVTETAPQYNKNAKYYADKSAGSATQSANSATQSANSATQSANSATQSANSATKSANSATQSANSATQSAASAENAKSLLESISISYDYETYKLTIEYTLPDSSVVTKEYDFALEPSIVSIDEVEKDGKYYLSLTLANGNKTEVELDDIFEGFVKSQAMGDRVYGTDSKGNDVLYSTDKVKFPEAKSLFADAVVLRRTDGDIYLQHDGRYDTSAARVSQVNKALTESKSYTTNTVGNFAQTVQNEIGEVNYRLEQLESASLKFTEYSGVTNAVPVPADAAKYVPVYKVGGMTYKSNNYFDKSKVTNATATDTGFKFTNTVAQSNPTIIGRLRDLAPQLRAGDVVTFYANVINLGANAQYGFLYLAGSRTDWVGGRFVTITEADLADWVYAYGALNEVCEYNDLIITKEENAPYSPYFEGLRDTKVTELVSEGANLIPPPTRNWTSNGITFSVQKDGSIVANGTATGEATYELIRNGLADSLKLEKGKTYTFSGCPANGSNTTYRMVIQHTGYSQNFDDFGSGVTKVTSYEDYYVFIRIYAGYTANNLVFKPMLNRGTTAAPYKPYRANAVDTLPISAELRAFLEDKGYGRGVSGYPNYIDFERKVFVQNTYRKVFDGTEPWGAYGTIDDVKYRALLLLASINAPMAAYRGSDVLGAIVSTHYETKSGNDIFTQNQGVTCADDFISYYDEAYNTTDISLWKAHLAELYANGNPLVIEYALGTPIETDISAYLTDDEIEVEGGGTIVPVNTDYNNAAFVEMLFTEKK